jgi:hypothetical protein
MGLGYPPLTRSRLSPLGGSVEGSRCAACSRHRQPGTWPDSTWWTCNGAYGAGQGGWGCRSRAVGRRIAQRSAGLHPETCAGATQRARVFPARRAFDFLRLPGYPGPAVKGAKQRDPGAVQVAQIGVTQASTV